jgi:uncharacterized protein (DUF433 family)
MQLEDYFDFNTTPVEHIRIKGTRIDIEHVIERYQMGVHPDRIAADYGDTLTPEQVYATLAYYHGHKDAVEAYFARGRERFQEFVERWKVQQPQSDAVERIKAIKAAWGALKDEQPV